MGNQYCNQCLIKLWDVFAGSQTSFKRFKIDFVRFDRGFQVSDLKLFQNRKKIIFNILEKDF